MKILVALGLFLISAKESIYLRAFKIMEYNGPSANKLAPATKPALMRISKYSPLRRLQAKR